MHRLTFRRADGTAGIINGNENNIEDLIFNCIEKLCQYEDSNVQPDTLQCLKNNHNLKLEFDPMYKSLMLFSVNSDSQIIELKQHLKELKQYYDHSSSCLHKANTEIQHLRKQIKAGA